MAVLARVAQMPVMRVERRVGVAKVQPARRAGECGPAPFLLGRQAVGAVAFTTKPVAESHRVGPGHLRDRMAFTRGVARIAPDVLGLAVAVVSAKPTFFATGLV